MIEQRHIVGLIFYSTPIANNTARVVSWSGCKYLCGTWIGYYVLVLNREAGQWKLTFISDLQLNCRQWMWQFWIPEDIFSKWNLLVEFSSFDQKLSLNAFFNWNDLWFRMVSKLFWWPISDNWRVANRFYL